MQINVSDSEHTPGRGGKLDRAVSHLVVRSPPELWAPLQEAVHIFNNIDSRFGFSLLMILFLN